MNKRLLWASIVGLTTCSQVPNSPYVGPNQPHVVSDGLSVRVVNVRSEEEATPWAQAYCGKLGRTAHFLRMEIYRQQRHQPNDSASFDCVIG